MKECIVLSEQNVSALYLGDVQVTDGGWKMQLDKHTGKRQGIHGLLKQGKELGYPTED
jgi:hypothetical protein